MENYISEFSGQHTDDYDNRIIALENALSSYNNRINTLESIALTTNNYTNYTVKKDGTGATGTWAINIDGSSKYFYSTQNRGSNFAFDANNPSVMIWSDYGSGGRKYRYMPSGFIYGGCFTIPTNNSYTASMSCQFAWDVSHNSTHPGTLWWRSFGANGSGEGYKNWGQISVSNTGGQYNSSNWNDYAEMRSTIKEIEAGRCIYEIGNDIMNLTTSRLQKGCKIVSDTYGYCIGESKNAKTPIAVSGRVLAYLLEDNEIAKKHIGDPVCSGPNGTVSIMTEKEEQLYPSRIIGTISSIPDYKYWGQYNTPVNGRIWIYVK